MGNWLTIIFALLIVLVVADGIRRTWKARRSRLYDSPSLKKSLKTTVTEDEIEEKPSYLSELPNGGARVVGYRDPKDIPPPISPSITNKEHKTIRPIDEVGARPIDREIKRAPEQVRLNLTETVPILMQPTDIKSVQESADKKYQRIEPTISTDQSIDNEIDSNLSATAIEQVKAPQAGSETAINKAHPAFTRAELSGSTHPAKEVEDDETDYEEDYEDSESYDHDENYSEEFDEDFDEDDDDFDDDELAEDDEDEFDSEDKDWNENDEDELSDSELDAEEIKTEAPVTSPKLIEPEEVIVINVMAQRAQVFEGNALLDIVLKCGLRFGSMNIFHRYSGNKGDGTLLFSMANIVKPGTFDLDTMDEFTTLGVSLFLTLPLDADSLQSFELMLETSQAIAQTLDGELKDEYRSVMTKQTIEHYRQRIRDFERKKLFRRPQ